MQLQVLVPPAPRHRQFGEYRAQKLLIDRVRARRASAQAGAPGRESEASKCIGFEAAACRAQALSVSCRRTSAGRFMHTTALCSSKVAIGSAGVEEERGEESEGSKQAKAEASAHSAYQAAPRTQHSSG